MAKRKTARKARQTATSAKRILAMGIPLEERREIYCRAVRAMVDVMDTETGIAKMQAARELIHLFAPDVAKLESESGTSETPNISFISPLMSVVESRDEDAESVTDAV
jgi:hypothetical protein